MNKLSLDLNALQVESFGTVETAETRGTVAAHAPTLGRTCTCPTVEGYSCPATCGIVPDTTARAATYPDCQCV